MVTTWFPPKANVAVVRVVKFCKYLHRIGWNVIVLCPDSDGEHSARVASLASEIPPSVTVVRVPRTDWLSRWDRFSERFLGHRFVRALFLPDLYRFWTALVCREVERVLATRTVDVIFTSCSPFSLNLVGLQAQSRWEIPWVTDFRDLWLDNPMRPDTAPYWYQNLYDARLEARTLERCQALIANTDYQARLLQQRYPRSSDRIHVIRNGYDPEDINVASFRPLSGDGIRFGFVGSLYQDYTPAPVLEALAQAAFAYRIYYIGGTPQEFERVLPGSCREKYEYLGDLRLAEYYGALRQLDVGVIHLPSKPGAAGWIPARFYDFAGAGLPMLALGPPEAEVARLIESGLPGRYWTHAQWNQRGPDWEQRLPVRSRTAATNPTRPEFERPYQTHRLSQIFDACAPLPKPSDSPGD